ncbi:MAG: nucleoside-diphosphate-sugar epimerase [Bacteroidia bacterium]|jgi:nucleoside-diphosphate-sugar epimerase
MKKALVLGAGGFIGSHLVKRLKKEGYWVRGVDLVEPAYSPTEADEFIVGDLRDVTVVERAINEGMDEVYQLAADMGGAGYIFTGDNDAHVMHNSGLINLHVVNECVNKKVVKVFYSSSACVYPERNQMDPANPRCEEDSVYPAAPDSEYGWEKLFSERLYFSFKRNHGLNAKVARFHNIFGPEGAWNNGKEKAPAAICRKVADADDEGTVEVWGDGKQTRSFLYVDDCLDAMRSLMESDFSGPINIGSEEMISINDFVGLVAKVSEKNVTIKNIEGPTGVRGRSSDNRLIREKLGWEPNHDLQKGIVKTYTWVADRLAESKVV